MNVFHSAHFFFVDNRNDPFPCSSLCLFAARCKMTSVALLGGDGGSGDSGIGGGSGGGGGGGPPDSDDDLDLPDDEDHNDLYDGASSWGVRRGACY